MEKKSEIERFFVLLMGVMVCFIIFCATGCGDGGKSCELPQCGTDFDNGNHLVGVSIPGCGGILTSGKSCGGCGLWSQAIKCSGGYIDVDKTPKKVQVEEVDVNGNVVSREKIESETKSCVLLSLDDRYYEDEGCGACSSYRARACYGFVGAKGPTDWLVAVGYPSREISVGCGSGCGACSTTDRIGAQFIYITEEATDISK